MNHTTPASSLTPVGHTHGISAASAGRHRLTIVLLLVLSYLGVQVVAGIITNSLALLADAGHMLTDAVGVGMALLAVHFAAKPATPGMSFGYYRLEILAAVANVFLLLGIATFIFIEAINRWGQTTPVLSVPMMAVAVVGLLINLISLRLLSSGAKSSLNLRGAYLEVLGDMFGSLAVLAAGVVIFTTGWLAADVIASVVIALLIVPRALRLLREAVDVLLQATPRDIDLAEVRAHLRQAAGVADAHDLHVWTLTSGMHVVSAHVVLQPNADPADVLDEICSCLADDFDMEHSTIQLESFDRQRLEVASHQ